jgi:predicted helicase
VIIGNPPYSAGQKSANDNAMNRSYSVLDKRIADTYAKESKATNLTALYDPYIKAFRWSSDRIKDNGIVAFITNGNWIDSNSMDGFRKYLEKEFNSIYVFNLRGGIKGLMGDQAKREGQNVFDITTRVAITLAVKKSGSTSSIKYYEFEDYLNRKEKFNLLNTFNSIGSQDISWRKLKPNTFGDWINKRSTTYLSLIPIGDKKEKKSNAFFGDTYSSGLKTARDAWCYDSSKDKVKKNVARSINFYNEQRQALYPLLNAKKNNLEDLLDFDSTKISWNRELKNNLKRNKPIKFDESRIYTSQYRPFFKQNLYFHRDFNDMIYQMSRIYPESNSDNILICTSGLGGVRSQSIFITKNIPDLNILDAGTQCFPLYWYEDTEESKGKTADLFDEAPKEDSERYVRRDGITDFALNTACQQYKISDISKEDIFYYVYGFLHSEDYRSAFDADLKKMLARIPFVESYEDFKAFEKAGRELAHYHLNYEDIPAYSGVEVEYKKGKDEADYTVTKLKFAKKRVEGKSVNDRSTIIYNKHITIKNIPEEAYDYEVNGRSAIEWIIDRYQVRTDKKSGITNDPNDWGREHGNKRYILDLLLSVITVSMESVRIVKSLPKLDFEE